MLQTTTKRKVQTISIPTNQIQSFIRNFISDFLIKGINFNIIVGQRLSRKRGGEPDKKTHRRRMGSKKKLLFKIIRFVSTAGTRFFYAKKKSRKIDLKKYDLKLKHHVLFTEAS
ncbi:hypothetical protein AAHE18_18G118600 [Arachis hypogaea]